MFEDYSNGFSSGISGSKMSTNQRNPQRNQLITKFMQQKPTRTVDDLVRFFLRLEVEPVIGGKSVCAPAVLHKLFLNLRLSTYELSSSPRVACSVPGEAQIQSSLARTSS